MSLLNYLQFQKIDSSDDDITEKHSNIENILLDDQLDENSLEEFWDKVVQDIRDDPEWFVFADDK